MLIKLLYLFIYLLDANFLVSLYVNGCRYFHRKNRSANSFKVEKVPGEVHSVTSWCQHGCVMGSINRKYIKYSISYSISYSILTVCCLIFLCQSKQWDVIPAWLFSAPSRNQYDTVPGEALSDIHFSTTSAVLHVLWYCSSCTKLQRNISSPFYWYQSVALMIMEPLILPVVPQVVLSQELFTGERDTSHWDQVLLRCKFPVLFHWLYLRQWMYIYICIYKLFKSLPPQFLSIKSKFKKGYFFRNQASAERQFMLEWSRVIQEVTSMSCPWTNGSSTTAAPRTESHQRGKYTVYIYLNVPMYIFQTVLFEGLKKNMQKW